MKKITRLSLLLALAVLPSSGLSQWVDNQDDTWTYSKSWTLRNWTLYGTDKATRPGSLLCSEQLAGNRCPSDWQGRYFLNLRRQSCTDSDVSAGRCDTVDDTWRPTVIQCGDGTYGGSSGTGQDYDYRLWSRPLGEVGVSDLPVCDVQSLGDLWAVDDLSSVSNVPTSGGDLFALYECKLAGWRLFKLNNSPEIDHVCSARAGSQTLKDLGVWLVRPNLARILVNRSFADRRRSSADAGMRKALDQARLDFDVTTD